MMRIVLSLSVFCLVACASPRVTEPPAPGPEPTSTAPTEMTPDDARTVVADIEARWPLRADHPLAAPKTLVDVENILKLDQVTLFAPGIAFLEGQQSVEAMALHGQIELAWAEAHMMLAVIMGNLHSRFSASLSQLESDSEAPDEDGQTTAEDLRTACEDLKRAGMAFSELIVEHLDAGWKMAEQTMQTHPDSYLGYRVAADYHRLTEDWDAFAETIEQVKTRNPDSNGLRFLKGAAAFQSERDRTAAVTYYREALGRDPQFVRAQVHLLMIQNDAGKLYEELQKLETLNPDHQVVTWAGESIEKAYREWQAEQPQPES